MVVARQVFRQRIWSVKRQDDSAIEHARLIGATLFIPAAGFWRMPSLRPRASGHSGTPRRSRSVRCRKGIQHRYLSCGAAQRRDNIRRGQNKMPNPWMLSPSVGQIARLATTKLDRVSESSQRWRLPGRTCRMHRSSRVMSLDVPPLCWSSRFGASPSQACRKLVVA